MQKKNGWEILWVVTMQGGATDVTSWVEARTAFRQRMVPSAWFLCGAHSSHLMHPDSLLSFKDTSPVTCQEEASAQLYVSVSCLWTVRNVLLVGSSPPPPTKNTYELMARTWQVLPALTKQSLVLA